MVDPNTEIQMMKDLQLQPMVVYNTVDPPALVVEKQIIFSIPKPEYIPMALLAAYYVFDMEYIKGSINVFTALQIMLLDKMPAKIPNKVGVLRSALQQQL
jgi:hypothetical protein